MDYLDFDLEVEAAGGRDYRIAARSPEGDTRQPMQFPFGKLELENHLLKLQNALLKSGGLHRDAVLSKEGQAVQDFGGSLFETLLSGNVRALYDACRTRASQEGRPGVRLRLRIQAPELAALPWEYLFDSRRGEYLCLSRRTPLVRHFEVAQPVLPLKITPPLRILAMVASPNDQPELNVKNEEGATHLLGATQLALLLANHDPLRLALLNACEGATSNQRDLFSSTAATLVKHGIPGVLAMQYAISDSAAIECSRAFYKALVGGLPVDSALVEARTALHVGVNNSLEWGTPVLFMRAPGSVLFDLPPLAPAPVPPPATPLALLQETPLPLAVTSPPVAPAKAEGHVSASRAAGSAAKAAPAPTKTAEQWVEEGMKHWAAFGYPEALAAFEQAIQLEPGNAAAQLGKGNTLGSLGRSEEARAVYKHALQLAPKDAVAYYHKGIALKALEREEEALAAFDLALQLDPTSGTAYDSKGRALEQLGRKAEAEQAFQKARELGYTR